jgi:hypothetical protein
VKWSCARLRSTRGIGCRGEYRRQPGEPSLWDVVGTYVCTCDGAARAPSHMPFASRWRLLQAALGFPGRGVAGNLKGR